MPQFHAVQCFQCEAFQVQQVKKTGKFTCSVCGARQSVRQASCCSDKAKDVRLVIMELNLKRGVKRKAEDKLLGQVQAPTMVTPAQEAVAGTCAPEWDAFVVRSCIRPPVAVQLQQKLKQTLCDCAAVHADDTQLPAVLEEAEQMESAAFVTVLPEGLENGGKQLQQISAKAGQQHQGASTQQQLGMQGAGAAMSSTEGSERRTAAITQLQARSARKVTTPKINRNATGLLSVQPELLLQRPLRVQGSLSAQQGSVHQRHPRRHSPVQQGPGWGGRAPVLQASNSNGPMWPPRQPAGSAEDGWGSFMTQQETMCAASDIGEDQDGLIFAID